MNLPTTSYILLGMLSAQERSGYDLKLLLDKQVHHVYWSPAKSQIYGELRRLEQAGLATMTEVEQTNRPDKRLYRITPAGREALQQWLANPDVEPDVFKSPLLLHLFFGHLLPRQALIAQFERRQQKLAAELEGYEKREQEVRDSMQTPGAEANLPFLLLTFQYQRSILQAALQWTTEAVAQLRRIKETAA
jgi:PadR family transcriptional regulator, regulatory protein AphA